MGPMMGCVKLAIYLATIPPQGSVAEWSIAPVLKTGDSKGSVSSNLTASARRPFYGLFFRLKPTQNTPFSL